MFLQVYQKAGMYERAQGKVFPTKQELKSAAYSLAVSVLQKRLTNVPQASASQSADTQISGSMDIDNAVDNIVWETNCTEVKPNCGLQDHMQRVYHNEPWLCRPF